MPAMTITTNGAQAQRLAAALGRELDCRDANGLPRDANAAEIKGAIIEYLRSVVVQHERRVAQAALNVGGFDPS